MITVGNPNRPLLLLLTVALAACSGDSGSNDAKEIRTSDSDSAGVRVVTTHAPEDVASGWRVADTPVVSIGEASDSDGGIAWNVVEGFLLADGRLALFSRSTRRVQIHDRDGRMVREIGTDGQGPGEFSEPYYLLVRDDGTLDVWERRFGPVISFDTAGTFVGERHLDLAEVQEALGTVAGAQLVAAFTDGSFLASRNRSRFGPGNRPVGEVYRSLFEYMFISRDMSPAPLGSYEGQEMFVANRSGSLPISPLFPAQASITAGGDPLRIYASDGNETRVRVFGADGLMEEIWHLERPPIPITVEEATRQVDWIASIRGEGVRSEIAQLPRQDHHPPFAMLKVDDMGHLWALDRYSREDSRWSVFRPDGTWVGHVQVPLRQVLHIGHDFILGARSDELRVQSVHLFELDRSPESE